MKKTWVRVVAATAALLALVVVGFVTYVEARASPNLQFPDTPSPPIVASGDPAVIERGRLLVHGAAHCAACHGGYDEDHPSALREDVPLSGGLELRPPFGVFRAANITSDVETGVGAWSDAELARVIRTGVRRDGELSLWTPELAAGLVAATVAWKTRNSILTLVVGMAVLIALDAL